MSRRFRPFALLAASTVFSLPAHAAPGGELTLDMLVDIRHPSKAAWSADGRRVAFAWERSGVEDVYVVGEAGGQPVALTRHEDGLVDGLFWSHDGGSVFFEKGGELFKVSAEGGGAPEGMLGTPEAESGITLSHDGARVAFSRKGDLFVRGLADGRETQLTRSEAVEEGAVWSPDDRFLAFAWSTSIAHEESPDYVGGKLVFRSQKGFAAHVGAVSAAGGPVIQVAQSEGTETAPRWVDAARIVLQRVSPDLRAREIVIADAESGAGRVLFRDEDPKFWSLEFLGAEPVPSPDGRLVAFLSDRDGWDHVYVVPSAGGEARALTRGRLEASGFAWSPDGKRLAVDVNDEDAPGTRQLVIVDVASGLRIPLTSGRGTNTLARWSPSGERVLYQHTGPRDSADLFVVDAKAGSTPRRLTDSFPAGLDRRALVEPRLVRYPSADGRSVPAYLFVPDGLDRTRKHPAIVWVHGDGITQNFDGWHTRRDYAVYHSFHQYLVQRGYVVLAVDYRGSIGYGREWRQGHYRDLGGKDYEDIAAGVPFLRSLGFVDETRVGVWGLSYGGFMALTALTVTPELFRCAIDVAGVQDWRYWYADPDGPWIKGRMGTPAENPDLYTRSSPIHQVDKIVRPLLVLHGTADVNVPFRESVRLVDVLLKAGKDFEFALYPGEFHYFQRAHVLRDAWRRVERFFDAYLKPGRSNS